MNRINKCLSSHKIEVVCPDKTLLEEVEKDMLKYSGCQKYHRVFNNSSFSNGGRFYGHWSQDIRSDFRKFIHIDGQPTVELDYSCLHIYMLYCMKGIRPPSGDLYSLHGIDPTFRSLVKIAVNIAFNAKNQTEAIKAINKIIIDQKEKNGSGKKYPYAKTILAAFKETHPDIQEFICTGMGIKLQFKDSMIAEKILLNFATRDICCLSIHDSFIVGREHKLELEQLMRDYFVGYFGYEPRIKAKDYSSLFEETDDTSLERIGMAA